MQLKWLFISKFTRKKSEQERVEERPMRAVCVCAYVCVWLSIQHGVSHSLHVTLNMSYLFFSAFSSIRALDVLPHAYISL